MTRTILWTGGFDSTWLVVDALLAGDRVEAFRWRGWGWAYQKAANEDAAVERIAHALPGPMRARLSHEPVEVSYARVRPGFEAAWQELRELCAPTFEAWNGQAPFLATLPGELGPAEAGYVADDKGPGWRERWAVLERAGLSFPVAGLTKAWLLADATRRGFAHLLRATWSCEALGPLDGSLRRVRAVPLPHRAAARARQGRRVTYTTVFQDYEAATLEEAAAAFFHDSNLWAPDREQMVSDYFLVRWEWRQPEHGRLGRLRCWFR